MITNKHDLKNYIKKDMIAQDTSRKKYIATLILRLNSGLITKYKIILRKEEYYVNRGNKLFSLYYKVRRNQVGRKIGVEIPPGVFGPGLKLPHTGLRIVAKDARVGKNCLLHSSVNIGTNNGNGMIEAPKIGDNVYIGPGVKIFGKITIANNIAIGANSVVTKSFTEEGITIAGVPAKKISSKGSFGKVPITDCDE